MGLSGIVYLGTSDYAATVLELLAGSPHSPTLVVTAPDRPAGRGRRVKAPPVVTVAKDLGIPLIQPESINSDEAVERIGAINPSVVCVCAYGQLIKEPLLSSHLMLNAHPSLLPRWRGAAPIERAIMAGDDETGVTIMRLTEGLDSGPIALQEKVTLDGDANYGEIAGKLAVLGGELLVSAIDRLDVDGLRFKDQDDSQATYAEKIDVVDRRLNLRATADEIVNQVRALSPHIGAYLEDHDGQRLKVLSARVVTEEGDQPGRVKVVDGRLLVACDDYSIELEQVQPPGGRPMDAGSYLRGHSVTESFQS